MQRFTLRLVSDLIYEDLTLAIPLMDRSRPIIDCAHFQPIQGYVTKSPPIDPEETYAATIAVSGIGLKLTRAPIIAIAVAKL